MRGLLLRLGVIIGMGTAVFATDPRAASATPRRSCAQCGTWDMCNGAFCELACGGVGEGAQCQAGCGETGMVLVDCGDVS